MSENQSHFKLYNKSPVVQLVITLILIMTIGMALLTLLVMGGILFSGLDMSSLSDNFLNEIGEKNINLLKYFMITQEIALFLVPAVIVRKMLLPDTRLSLNDFGFPKASEIALVIILAFSLFPLTGFSGQFNAEMKLPGWLSGIEQWMRVKEDTAAGIIDLLVPSETAGIMIVNLIVIAVLPAISEELIFRGVFQKIFQGFFKSGHAAIWLTAFLFSAMHLQFYGFLPRLILGLVFGYLYYWSGTLWLPMIAHFINNAVPVIVTFMQGTKDSEQVSDIAMWEQYIILSVSILICTMILVYFRNNWRRYQSTGESLSGNNGFG